MQQPPNSYPQYPQQQWQQPPNQPQYPPQPEQYQQPQYPYPQPQYRPPQSQPPKKKSRKRLWLLIGAIIVIFIISANIGAHLSPSSTDTTNQATQSTQQAQPTQILTPQSIHYPPITVADLHGLAAKGDASAIHEFHSESVGAVGACPQPKREVTVDPSLTGQQLAEDLLAYFYAQQLDSPCGSVVFAYHNQSEAGDAYTVGRILVDVTDSSGQVNLDPNATNLKHTLTLDIGDVSTGQEYIITY